MVIYPYISTIVLVQESRIYSMISDGLQMSRSSTTDRSTSQVNTLSTGELLMKLSDLMFQGHTFLAVYFT